MKVRLSYPDSESQTQLVKVVEEPMTGVVQCPRQPLRYGGGFAAHVLLQQLFTGLVAVWL